MGAVAIWQGVFAKLLADTGLKFKDGTTIQPYTGDPNGVISAQAGSVLLDKTNLRMWVNVDGATAWNDSLQDLGAITFTPTGFPNKTDTALNASGFAAGAGGTVTVQDVGGGFTIYSKGASESFTGDEDFTIPATTGLYFCSWDSSFTKTVTTLPWKIEEAPVLTAIVYYNDATGDYLLGEERHGTLRNSLAWHNTQHHTVGALYRSGFGVTGYTLSSDTLADVQIAIGAGLFHDEDIENGRAGSPLATPKAVGDNWDKWYRDGAAGPWAKGSTADTIPAFHSGNVPKINQDTGGGVWGLVDVTNNEYFNAYIIATNSAELTNRFILIPGQNEYGSNEEAVDLEGPESLNLGQLPTAEVVFLYKITMQYKTPFTGNDARIEITNVQDLRGTRFPGGAPNPTNHNSLGGRSEPNAHPTSSIAYPAGVGNPVEITNLQEYIDRDGSAGCINGCEITATTPATPSVDVAAGEVHLRNADTPTAPLRLFPFTAETGVGITSNDITYIYADYTTLQYQTTNDITSIPATDQVVTSVVAHAHGQIHYLNIGGYTVDFMANYARMRAVTSWLEHGYGAMVSEPSPLALAVTAGGFYIINQLITTIAFDTSVAGTANENVFRSIYQDAVGWQSTADQKTIDVNNYNQLGVGLTALSSNRWGVHWLYLVIDSPDRLHLLYGQGEYQTRSAAEAAQPPTDVSPELESYGVAVLVGKVVFRQGDTSIDTIQSPFLIPFVSSTATGHNGLSGLQGGDGALNQYYHLSLAEYNSVTQLVGANKDTILDNQTTEVNFGSLSLDETENIGYVLRGMFIVGTQESYIETKFVWDGSAWRTSQSEDFDVPSGVVFSATAAGAVQYTSGSYGVDGSFSWTLDKFSA